MKLPQTQKLQRQRDFQGTKKSKQTMAKSCINSEHKTWKSKQNVRCAQDSTLTKGKEKWKISTFMYTFFKM